MNGEGDTKAPSAKHHVYTLDFLMNLRQSPKLQRQLLLTMGDVNVHQLRTFIDGYRECQSVNGITDEEHIRFSLWLRDVKHEFPGEGWDAKYLRDCDGDHERAIRKYLDFVAEFVARRERPGSPDGGPNEGR